MLLDLRTLSENSVRTWPGKGSGPGDALHTLRRSTQLTGALSSCDDYILTIPRSLSPKRAIPRVSESHDTPPEQFLDFAKTEPFLVNTDAEFAYRMAYVSQWHEVDTCCPIHLLGSGMDIRETTDDGNPPFVLSLNVWPMISILLRATYAAEKFFPKRNN